MPYILSNTSTPRPMTLTSIPISQPDALRVSDKVVQRELKLTRGAQYETTGAIEKQTQIIQGMSKDLHDSLTTIQFQAFVQGMILVLVLAISLYPQYKQNKKRRS